MSSWPNRSEERRLRCRVTTVRNGRTIQCIGHSRVEHVHQSRGVPFGDNITAPPTFAPTTDLLLSPKGMF